MMDLKLKYLKAKKFLKAFYTRLNLNRRIILLYLVLVCVPVGAIMFFYYTGIVSIVEEETIESTFDTLRQAEFNITYFLENTKEVSNMIVINPTMQKILSNGTKPTPIQEQIEEAQGLEKLFESVQSDKDILKVRFFIDGKIYSSEQVNFFSLDKIASKDWFDKVQGKNGDIYWKSTYTEEYIDINGANIVSCIRLVKNSMNFTQSVGVLALDVSENALYKVLSQMSVQSGNEAYIVDAEGFIVSHGDKSLLGKSIVDQKGEDFVFEGSSGVKSVRYEDLSYFVVHTRVPLTGWSIVTEIPAFQLRRETGVFSAITTFMLIFILVTVFAVIIFMLFNSVIKTIHHRIKLMVEAMNTPGVFLPEEIKINSASTGLHEIERSINSLVETVHKLMDETYDARIKEREAQLKALQAQINPHFLYNTLDSINWMAVKLQADDISFMIDSLATYFRLSLNKGKDVVTIKDELRLAQVYLDIQLHRFDNSFSYELDIEAGVEDYYIPKLLLQPIVENAVMHGVRESKKAGAKVYIGAKKVGKFICFTISDTGIGMSEEQASHILTFTNAGGGSSGYGLYNVNERIKVFFGASCGITIKSEPGAGTEVEIKIKCIENSSGNYIE